MEKPNITEERFDEIMLLATRVDAVIDIMCADYEPHERYIVISLLFTQQIAEHTKKGDTGALECEENLLYVRDMILKKANSLAAKEKNG